MIRTILFSVVICLRAYGEPVSYYREMIPIFKRSCNGCHHPGKMKGDLDLTTHATILKGGKHGSILELQNPQESLLVKEISGDEPSMPADGEPLSSEEVALIERWIKEGASDDTPEDKRNPFRLAAPPEYRAPPVISSMVFSPDGSILAVAGYHEVLLQKDGGGELLSRLVGESPKIESLAFSADGKLLAVAAGAPAVFGEVQVWNVSEGALLLARRVSLDSVYGISFSPDGTKIAFGGADKSVRIMNVADGTELIKFDNHSDWVFRTTFTADGKRLLSGSRDRAMKLINAENGQFIDDINKLLEPVLCFSRHPKRDQVVYGGELGNARIYRISDNQGRTAANNDNNLVKEFERQPGAVYAVAFSADGDLVAIGSARSEVRIYRADGTRASTLEGHAGAIFAIAWHPRKREVLTAGHEGRIRVYDPETGEMIRSFIPFPLEQTKQAASH